MPAVTPPYAMTISGQPKYPQNGSLHVSRSLNQRDTAEFSIFTTSNTVAAFSLGQQVHATDGAISPTDLFTGRIEVISEGIGNDKAGIDQSTQKWWKLSCVSHDKILDRFYFSGSWTGQTMGYIVRDLIGRISTDGITASNVEDGPIIPQYDVTTPTKLSDILADLNRQTKYPYYVELISDLTSPIHTDLHMFDPTSGATVFSLTDGTKCESLDPVCDLTEYRNRQNVITGALSNIESFAGSGAAPQTVTLSLQASSVTSVEVDGSPKTVGVQGVDTGKDWYYTVNSASVVQDAAATAIPDTSTIKIKYLPRKADTLHGNGTANPVTLNTTKPIKSVSSIVLNGGTALNVGILGTDPLASKDWLYAPNGTTIQQGSGGPLLAVADNLVVDYEPVPGIIMKENTAEQTYRASIEGGTGIHEAYDNAVDGGTEADADALCTELLAKFGVSNPGTGRQDVREINFRLNNQRETTAVALKPGARVGVNLVSRGITGNFLISSVSISDVGGVSLAFDVRITRDRFISDWEPFYDKPQATSATPAATTATAAIVDSTGTISF